MATPRTPSSRSSWRRISISDKICLSFFDQKEWGTQYILLIDLLLATLNLINLFKDKRYHLKWPSNPLLNGDTSDVVVTLKFVLLAKLRAFSAPGDSKSAIRSALTPSWAEIRGQEESGSNIVFYFSARYDKCVL